MRLSRDGASRKLVFGRKRQLDGRKCGGCDGAAVVERGRGARTRAVAWVAGSRGGVRGAGKCGGRGDRGSEAGGCVRFGYGRAGSGTGSREHRAGKRDHRVRRTEPLARTVKATGWGHAVRPRGGATRVGGTTGGAGRAGRAGSGGRAPAAIPGAATGVGGEGSGIVVRRAAPTVPQLKLPLLWGC